MVRRYSSASLSRRRLRLPRRPRRVAPERFEAIVGEHVMAMSISLRVRTR
jgi:hypothetical protein